MQYKISEELRRFNYLITETNAAYHEAAVKLGLSDSASTVLYTLRLFNDECFIGDIINLSGISKQTLNSALRKLEKEDIIYLIACQGNKKKICLTEKGRMLAEKTVDRMIQIENDIFESWPEIERELYNEFTQRYLTDFKEKIKDLSRGE